MINNFDNQIQQMTWIVVITMIFYFCFILSRYRSYPSNVFVIHLRNGKIRTVGLGGKILTIPRIDKIHLIPASIQKISLELHDNTRSKDHQPLSGKWILLWRVMDPSIAFKHLNWNPELPNYVENILKDTIDSITRKLCDTMILEQITNQTSELSQIFNDKIELQLKSWGIQVESFEIDIKPKN